MLVADEDHGRHVHVRANPREQRRERGVDDQHAIAGVIDDIRQFVGRKPQVERVQHRAGERRGEIGFEMLRMAPAQRCHAIAAADAKTLEHGHEPTRPLRERAIG